MCLCCYFWWVFIPVSCFLKPDFNCCTSFALSWVDKVATRTYSFVFVIANVPAVIESVITQVNDQGRMTLILQVN